MLNLFKRGSLKTIDKVSLDKEIENYSLSGVTGDEKGLIISLTSFPQRMYEIHYTLYSLLTQTVKPAKVILWLGIEQFPNKEKDIPKKVLQFLNYGLEIKWCNNTKSYKKLIPALKEFPNDVIVTIDDDIRYHPNMLRDLVRLHKRLPNAIIAHRVRKIKLNTPYRKWRKYKWYDFIFKKYHFSYLAMQTGVGGVLYPPHSLDEKMLDPALFMAMAPTNDDVWFWAAAVSSGTYVVPLPNGQRTAKGVGKPMEYALMNVNLKSGKDRNREALERILEYFPKIRIIALGKEP